jgi:threonine/homoserine/homoserine lactone efflux protein
LDYFTSLLTIAGVLTLSVMSPGPNVALVTATAVGVSRRAGIMTGLGLAAASLTWTLLAVTGLGVIVAQGGCTYAAMKIAGAAYLIVLGIKMILGARRPAAATTVQGNVAGFAALRKGFFVSMTNATALAFYGSVLAVMVPEHAPRSFYAAIVMMALSVSATWYCGLAYLFSVPALRSVLQRAKTAIDSLTGAFLIAVGGRMLAGR